MYGDFWINVLLTPLKYNKNILASNAALIIVSGRNEKYMVKLKQNNLLYLEIKV